MKRKIVSWILIMLGVAVMSIPLYWKYVGNKRSQQMLEEFQRTIDEKQHEKEDYGKKIPETVVDEENAAILSKEEVIGLIEIKSLDLKYPIVEGTGRNELSLGIGHIPDTAEIGKNGNCVLAGHRGSRYGAYFKYLNRLSIGDEIKLTDKEGNLYLYEVVDMKVVGAYDNSVKNQGEEREITLLTCENSGTMRLIVICAWKGVEE
ncbi:MAG: sortase [Lachnospiraceae bacterium]|nr:sortase [Lachnospiraceae bacterium]